MRVSIDGFMREVLVVGHTGGGAIARPVDATSIRELVFLDGEKRAHPLVAGPSFLTLLEVFPQGDLPDETAAAILEALAPPPWGSASLQRLRFDLDDRVFRWSAAPDSMRPTEFTPWRNGLIARLFGRKGPSFERLFIARVGQANGGSLEGGPEGAHAGGREHLAGMVTAMLGERLERDRERREQWWLHDGDEPRVRNDGNTWMAERFFVEAEHDAVAGRRSAARMKATQASIYDPDRERYRRALRAMEPRR